MENACLATPQHQCTLIADAPQSLEISGTHKLPPSMHVRFTENARWTLHGGTLDFDGASIEAPAASQVFAGEGRVQGLALARPEWFAQPEGSIWPAAALRAAYLSTVVNGTIQLNAASYISPFTWAPALGGPRSELLAYDSPRTFLGAGRPSPDNESSPTKLVGGTIILGMWGGSAALRAAHLGLDDGPFAVALFHGIEGYGIVLGTTRKLGIVGGTDLQDISVLTNGVHDQHSVIIEGQHHATVDGLWVWTLGGTHGLVIKSSDTRVHDFHCKGASADCLIVKSDYATDKAGYAERVSISDVWIRYLRVPGDTGGIAIDSRWDSVRSLTMSDVHEQGLTLGISASGSDFHTLRHVVLQDWSAEDMLGSCLVAGKADDFTVTHFGCALLPAAQGAAIYLNANNISLQDGSIRCAGETAACAAAHTDGIVDMNGTAEIRNIRGLRLGGYLLRSAAALNPKASALQAEEMDGRVLARYVPLPWSVRRRIAMQDLKGDLRILSTMLEVRPAWKFGLLAFAITSGAAMVYGIFRRRRYATNISTN